MNKLSTDKRVRLLRCLVDGASIRATARICDVAINTVVKLLVDAGRACSLYQDKAFHDLPCQRIQCDEIWSYIYAKEKNAPEALKKKGKAGDIWTWTALCADTKLVPCWFVGPRDAGAAYHFIHDLAVRLRNRVQLTTDGHKAYLNAVEDAFGSEIDYAMLVKLYGNAPEHPDNTKYSPSVCMGSRVARIKGDPKYEHISTSFVERQNLTMRMNMRRFTRLTNAFSKKAENHEAAVALHFMYYNFCRIHQSLRITPAMAAGVTDHAWEIEELLVITDQAAS
ncbi:MAG: DDE-type integrase/transposase/recombinase [Kiritimatiellae bacterium]|nr:DDE-type integrase/transposase/recombinase [Kiritimatiellia bacterium]